MEKVNFTLNNQFSESYLDPICTTVEPCFADSMTCGTFPLYWTLPLGPKQSSIGIELYIWPPEFLTPRCIV